MKNLFKVLIVAVATTALFACDKENESETGIIRTVQFAAGPVSKTVFGTLDGSTLPTLWTENKTVGISLNFATAKQSTTPEVAGVGTTANFQAEIEDSGSAPYTFYAVSPYSSLISVNSNYKSAKINIPTSQTPLATSVDESAQILVAKNNVGYSFPSTSVTMAFEHLTAYGKISFKNLTLADGEAVASITLTAAENWAGQYYYYFEDNDKGNNYGDFVATSASKTITISTSNSSNIWFACAPVDLGGKQVKVVIATDQGNTYTKRITIPVGEKYLFKSGNVNAFTINMNGIEPDGPVQYELVTNPADLTVGSQVIIAAPGTTEIAMSTTQNTNNRGMTSVTKAQDGAVITSPGDAVQILTIEVGNKENTIAFSTGDGYLYAASSSNNYLRTEATLSNNSSWTVSITSEGEATLTAQGTNTRNVIRYNGSNNPPIYSCYASSSSTGSLVSLYMLAYDWILDNISVTTSPTKTIYEAGEDFDPAGMVVTAHYVDADDNTHTKDVIIDNSSLTVSPSANLTAGTTSVSISFAGQSTTQEITVTAPITWDLKSIAVTTEPTKTTYSAGETFDPAGMVVTATYENHDNTEQTKQEVVDNGDLTFSPTTSTPLTTSDESVSITYGGKSTTQAITVNAASATAYYVKVTSELNDWSGQYLFVFETNNVAFDGSLENLDSTPNTFEVSISDSKIASSAAIDAKSFTIASVTGGYSIQAATGKYIGRSANSNGMDKSDDALVNTISWSNSQPLVAGSGDRKLGFNNDSNQKKFRYLGSPSAIQLYKLEDNTTWDLSSIAVTTAPTKTTYEAGEDFDATGMQVTAHYVDADDNTHIKDVILDNGDLEINPSTNLTAGTTSVTISYGGQNTSQAITVSAAKVWDLKSIAVKTAPTKTTYTEGDFFDPAGLVITPTFENRNNTAETKTGVDVAYSNDTAASFAFSPTTSTALLTTDTSVGISYTASGITKSTTQAITVNSASQGGTLTIDFESAASLYTDWTFSNVRPQQTNSNVTAHGGSYFGNTTNDKGSGVSSNCHITTANKISSPSSITFYISKQSTNTTASTWEVKVSSNGTSWTTVGSAQNAGNGITRGTWYEVTRDLSSYSDVYVRIEYSGSTAIRDIDDVILSYN